METLAVSLDKIHTRVNVRRVLFRHWSVQKLAQGLPPIAHMVLEKSFGWHQRSNLFVVFLLAGYSVAVKILVVENFLQL